MTDHRSHCEQPLLTHVRNLCCATTVPAHTQTALVSRASVARWHTSEQPPTKTSPHNLDGPGRGLHQIKSDLDMASASYFKQVEDQEDAFDEELVRRRIAKCELARRFAIRVSCNFPA